MPLWPRKPDTDQLKEGFVDGALTKLIGLDVPLVQWWVRVAQAGLRAAKEEAKK